jgi:hypothetical protein
MFSQPFYRKSTLMAFSRLLVYLPKGIFFSGLLMKTYMFISTHAYYMSFHCISFELNNLTRWVNDRNYEDPLVQFLALVSLSIQLYSAVVF